MISQEKFVGADSKYFVYSPSKNALEMFLYPLQCGRFVYLPGYHLVRESFDSFLLMYIQKGSLSLNLNGHEQTVNKGQLVLLDCYSRHAYSTKTGWECLWCHFDGITARHWYQNIVSRFGNVFSLPDPQPIISNPALYLVGCQGRILCQSGGKGDRLYQRAFCGKAHHQPARLTGQPQRLSFYPHL